MKRTWIYQGTEYTSIPFKNDIDIIDYHKANSDKPMYHSKWDKVYKVIALSYMGNGNRLKAYVVDIYTNAGYYTEAKWLEKIVKVSELCEK